jgi:hypothetical protein
MAHYAKIDNNNIVLEVIVVNNENAPNEQAGKDFIASIGIEGVWLQTSYNTRQGVHTLGGVAFRGNFAGVGHTYDPIRDAFIPPKEYPSYVFDEEKFIWINSIPKPKGDEIIGWAWNEETLSWDSFTK